ncbi:MAG: S8 family serine peptidase [Verrucomicrobia bacterium]|nr:S8 family serine peptidase [Verrucomicrobiota bacterium]
MIRWRLWTWLALASAGPVAALDLVRPEIRLDAALAQYDVRGSNVVVAILDRGIDWENADFRDAEGKTRIEYIYDLSDNSGAGQPGNFQGRGTVYTRTQIDAALASGTRLATRDAVGHGTTTAGIAAGGGVNEPKYRGIAPGARLIVVKVTSEGAPAHDGELAEAPFYDPALIPVAMDFAKIKSAELGLPCVMLLNIGSVGGPTDGTSALCRKIDATVGPGKPGLAFVTGTSDDGGAANRAKGTVAAGQTLALQLEKVGTGTLTFDLWYSEQDRFDVRLITPAGTFGPYAAPAAANGFDTRTVGGALYYHLGRDRDFNEAQNQRRQLWIRFSGAAGTYTVELIGRTVVDGTFDATLNPSRFQPGNPLPSRFLNFTAPGSIWDLASASNNICPNSYVIRRTYQDLNGITRNLNEGAIGGLWNGSGVGPTFDGRLGMDVSAPGDSLMTVYGPRSYWATFPFNRVPATAGVYGRASAVSAANPIVTGVIALLLEMDPTLDAGQIKQILQQTARADAFTGEVPNANWGYGKIDALAAVELLHRQLTQPTLSEQPDGSWRLRARGHRGKAYTLEQSSDLRTWEPQGQKTAAVEPMEFSLPPATGARFFRLTR